MRKFTYGHVWKMGTRHFVFIIIIIIVGSAAAVAVVVFVVVCFGMYVQFMHRKKVGTTYCKDKFHFFLPPSSPSSLLQRIEWHIRLRIQHTYAQFFHLIRHLFTLNVFISWNINYICVPYNISHFNMVVCTPYIHHTRENTRHTLWKFVWIRMNTKSRKNVQKYP